MTDAITLNINNRLYTLKVDPKTPLLYVLRNDCGLVSPKYGCGIEQCGACKVLIDGEALPTCQLPVGDVIGKKITTLEGFHTDIDHLHPVQQAFIDEQAAQCGFCSAGMITTAVALYNQTDQPTDDEIRENMERHICRCGVYDRVYRAICKSLDRPLSPKYTVTDMPPLQSESANAEAQLPYSIQQYPALDDWIRMNIDGTISVFSGKIELGQGIKTALAQIASEALGVDIRRIEVVTGDTGRTPNEGGTTGSMSIEMSGSALWTAATQARQILLSMAFEELEARTPASNLLLNDGTITDPETGRSTTYHALMGGKRFGQNITPQAPAHQSEGRKLLTKAYPRADLLAKFTGQVSFVHDMNLPDMLHARILRPPNYTSRLRALDVEAIERLPGVVRVIQDGSFVAIVSHSEAQAIGALYRAQSLAQWQTDALLPDQSTLFEQLKNGRTTSNRIVDGAGVDEPIPPIEIPPQAAQTLKASFHRPYHMHASLGTSAAVALWQDDQLTVWSHSQSVFNLRDSLAQVLGLATEKVRVIHEESAGCYGHNGADDVALDAALVAMQTPEYPVSVKWTRDHEHKWEPYGSAMVMDMQASLDTNGKVIDWNHDVWSYGHSTRPYVSDAETSGLLASWHLEKPFKRQQPRTINGYHFGAHRNADPLYAFPKKRVVRHDVVDSPLRVSALRSLGAYANVFAIESFMDELAHAAEADPLDFRLNHLSDERAKAVLEAVAGKADWQSRRQHSTQNTGWGIAFAQYKNRQCYAAVVVQVAVDTNTGKIQVKRAYIAADAGLIINADGLSNQLEGGFAQALSWTLFEAVHYNENGIISDDWETYPVLRFPDAPIIETVLLNRPDQRSIGAGEASTNPTPAAIANAVYDAVGVRLRDIPFTPEKVKALLEQ